MFDGNFMLGWRRYLGVMLAFLEIKEKKLSSMIFNRHLPSPPNHNCFLLRPPEVESDYEIQIQSVNLYELMFETIQLLPKVKGKKKKERHAM